MQVLIMGSSRLAALAARSVSAKGHQVRLIDTQSEALRRFSHKWYVDSHIGDGVLAEDLKRAGIEQAQAFMALSDDENSNAMAAQVARQTFHIPKVLCLVHDPERVPVYSRLGIIVLCPNTSALEAIDSNLRP